MAARSAGPCETGGTTALLSRQSAAAELEAQLPPPRPFLAAAAPALSAPPALQTPHSDVTAHRAVAWSDTPKVRLPPQPQQLPPASRVRMSSPRAPVTRSPEELKRRYRNRTAFTWQGRYDKATVAPEERKIAETAKLVGVGKEISLDAEFFRRRSRFRRTMQRAIADARADGCHPNKAGELDLPGYWTRPTLEARRDAGDFVDGSVKCFFAGTAENDFRTEVVEVACSPRDRMSELLDNILFARPDGHKGDPGLDDPTCYILKARGLQDYLDGDELLMDYRFLRRHMDQCTQPHLTVLRRAELESEIREQEAELLNEDGLGHEEGDEDAEEEDEREYYGEMKRGFDPAIDKRAWEFIPVTELRRKFRVCIVGVDYLPLRDMCWRTVVDGEEEVEQETLQIKTRKDRGAENRTEETVYVQAGLYHGGKLLQQLGEPFSTMHD